MSKDDIMEYHPGEELSMYPDKITLGNRVLSCSYSFDPGEQDDGVTLHVPSDAVSTLPLESADWQIPALVREKITALIKGLPKEYRKQLVPIPQTVDSIVRDIKDCDSSIITYMAQFIHEKFNINIPAAAWPVEGIPDYLKMRFSIMNEKGEKILSSRDVRSLQENLPDSGEFPALKVAKTQWEIAGITSWDFADIPESIILNGKGGIEGLAYPALERGNDGNINLRLFQRYEKGGNGTRKRHRRALRITLQKGYEVPEEVSRAASGDKNGCKLPRRSATDRKRSIPENNMHSL